MSPGLIALLSVLSTAPVGGLTPAEGDAPRLAALEPEALKATAPDPGRPNGLELGGVSPANPPGSVTLTPSRNFLVPAIEVPALNLAIWSFDRYALQAEFAKVTPQTIGENLRGGWEIDTDDLWMNFIGHAYHGSLAFNAARSNGLGFWESLPAPLVNSFLWEVAGEAEPPSINDLVISSASGALVGEAFHRLSSRLWDGPSTPVAGESLVGAVLNPIGALNRRMFGQRRPRASIPELPPVDAALRLGAQATGGGRVPDGRQLHGVGSIDVTYGVSPLRTPTITAPLSVFRLRGELGAPTPVAATLRLEGLVAGTSLSSGSMTGAWGLFGVHQFETASGHRVAGSGVGPGVVADFSLDERTVLRVWSTATAVLLGGAGTFEQTDLLDRNPELGPAYAMGPGAAATLDAELHWTRRGRVRGFAESQWLRGTGEHLGVIQSLRGGAAAEVEVGAGHGFGTELRADELRMPGLDDARFGWTARLFWVTRFGDTSR